MSDGFLKEYISPLLICDTNTMEATEEVMEDIYDRCQVLTLGCGKTFMQTNMQWRSWRITWMRILTLFWQ